MDIVEKIIANVGKTTKAVVQRSNDMVELTKLKLAIGNAENEARDVMCEIGRLVYTAYKNGEGEAELVEAKCVQLDEIRDTIAEKKSEYARLRNMKHCPKCHKENDDDALFCSACGERLNDEAEAFEMTETADDAVVEVLSDEDEQ